MFEHFLKFEGFFQGNKMIPFIKITLAVPKLIAPAKRLLEKREVNFRDFNNISYAAFESNIDFEIRFMADTKVVGCNWIELPPKKHMMHKLTGEAPNWFEVQIQRWNI